MDKKIMQLKTFLKEGMLEATGPLTETHALLMESAHKASARSRKPLAETSSIQSGLIGMGPIGEAFFEVTFDNKTINSETLPIIKDDLCKKFNIKPESLCVRKTDRYFKRSGNAPHKGEKVGHKLLVDEDSYGTLGGYYKKGSKTFVVSNNHVLAAENQGKKGDDIYHIMPSGHNVVASLNAFVKLNSRKENVLDLAIAQLDKKNKTPFHSFKFKRKAIPRERVVKVGATTGVTFGIISSVDYELIVGYDKFDAYFENQLQIVNFKGEKIFCDGGDSGSLIYSLEDGAILGLLFAGNNSETFANHISTVSRQIMEWIE